MREAYSFSALSYKIYMIIHQYSAYTVKGWPGSHFRLFGTAQRLAGILMRCEPAKIGEYGVLAEYLQYNNAVIG